MILGRGSAQTDMAIVAEYRSCFATSSGIATKYLNQIFVVEGYLASLSRLLRSSRASASLIG